MAAQMIAWWIILFHQTKNKQIGGLSSAANDSVLLWWKQSWIIKWISLDISYIDDTTNTKAVMRYCITEVFMGHKSYHIILLKSDEYISTSFEISRS